MIYEYAISPSIFNTEDRVTLFTLSLGMDQGRLISDFPKDKWEQLALFCIKKAAKGDVQLKAWKECLVSLRKKAAIVRRQGAGWDDAKTWLDNAVQEHQRWAFRAIVDESTSGACAEVLPVGVGLATSNLWNITGDQHVARQASAMVDQMKGLLDLSGTIILIDRNFLIDGRFTNVLACLASYVKSGKKGSKVEQIKYVVSDLNFQPAELEARCRAMLPSIIPTGIAVKFFMKQKSKLHDRFVLTERGGLDFGQGLDEGGGQVLVKRLGYMTWEKEWNEWDKDCYHSFEIR